MFALNTTGEVTAGFICAVPCRLARRAAKRSTLPLMFRSWRSHVNRGTLTVAKAVDLPNVNRPPVTVGASTVVTAVDRPLAAATRYDWSIDGEHAQRRRRTRDATGAECAPLSGTTARCP